MQYKSFKVLKGRSEEKKKIKTRTKSKNDKKDRKDDEQQI